MAPPWSERREKRRNLAAFWLLGLLNNSGGAMRCDQRQWEAMARAAALPPPPPPAAAARLL